MIDVVKVQWRKGVFSLDKLENHDGGCGIGHEARAVHTSLRGSILDRTSSVAFLTSSISSEPETTTTHCLKVATLNRPGLA